MRRRPPTLRAIAQSYQVDIILSPEQEFLNGELNRELGTFDYSNGGGDPLWESWKADNYRRTLADPRLNLTEENQAGIRSRLAQPGDEYDMAERSEGEVLGHVMVSGDGKLAFYPRLVSMRWQPDLTTRATWRRWTNPRTGKRFEIIIAHVCRNPIITWLDGPNPCRCIPSMGDACIL